MWYTEAGKYNVFPIDGSGAQRAMVERPQVAEPRAQYVYRPGTQTLPFWVAARVLNRPHSITADAEIPDGGAEGVLLCQGSSAGGWSFYVKDGRLCYAHNYVGRATYQVTAPDALPAGRHQLRFEFEPTDKPDIVQGKGSPGRAQLYVDGQLIAQNEFPVTTPVLLNPGGLTCAANPGSPVTSDYRAPFRFTGTLYTVTVDLSGDLITDSESEMRMAMARQ
jgi:arylsulfatase